MNEKTFTSLSQKDRKDRIGNAKKINVIDNSVESLLHQAEEIAGFVRYFNFSNKADGYFNQFLQDLHEIRLNGIKNLTLNGKLEPSQALLFTFIRHLHEIGQDFNQRFHNYIWWYLNHYLNPKPLSIGNHKVCLLFNKNISNNIILEKGTGFILKDSNNKEFIYKLTENTSIKNISIKNFFSLHFRKQKDIYPASYLNYVTSLMVSDLKKNSSNNGMMFSADEKSKHAKKLGYMLSSPSLLLREGKRHVKIRFDFENSIDIHSIINQLNDNIISENKPSLEGIKYLFSNNIFFLSISTLLGWEKIDNYIIKTEDKYFTIEFLLPVDFPATSFCEESTHKFNSKHPSLRFILNADAWLYAYSWTKNILLKEVVIDTQVSEINNLLIYNDLGQIDNSKPFCPFGVNTEKGAWFTVGNYEMALKNTISVDLKIEWSQLPCENSGLHDYYKAYNKGINNASFKIKSRYLSDYHWRDDKTFYLFSSEAQQENNTSSPNTYPSNSSKLKDISVEKMPQIKIDEENYEYNIHTQSGFINFVLTEPEIGFGEKYYRNLFADYIINSTHKKKKKLPSPNPPINPQVERITMSYKTCDKIDFRKKDDNCNDSDFYHISPLGYNLIYPSDEIDKVPLIYSLETDANILIQLEGLKEVKSLNLYFEFMPADKEITLENIPDIKWYFGNGYQWQEVPDGNVIEDKTGKLLASGIVKINIPANINASLFDHSGRIWLRIGIIKNENLITWLKNVYTDISEAELKIDEDVLKNNEPLQFTGELEFEQKIPGIESVVPIAFYGGRQKETQEEMLMRISEYISHRGKAITTRDIERITLQEFPDIGKAKCLSNYNSKSDEKGVTTLVVIPNNTNNEKVPNYKPLANSRQILKIEYFLNSRKSAYCKKIDVINPIYEKVIIRCKIKFTEKTSTAACCTKLKEILNDIIAPWQSKHQLPYFNYNLNIVDIRGIIINQDFVNKISHLSVIHLTHTKDDFYKIYEYDKKGNDNNIIKPTKPYAIFIPAKEHIIINIDSCTESSEQFGINEMEINENFIISGRDFEDEN
ncbi:MAG: baseplate J/gp47 family protein [Bacteroidales bacterium]|jgi:hypothetical protein|nr:baseplate J/gp47 family protein [Bacteroidales bacterium]